MPLKSNLIVYPGIPWLRDNDEFYGYLKSCFDCIKKQETQVTVLPPKLTAPYAGKFSINEKTPKGNLLYAIMDRMNAVIEDYMRTNATHLLIVDADVEIPPHTVETLIRHDVDIASGVYPFHNFDYCKAMMFGRMGNNPCGFFHPRNWDYMKGQVFGEEFPVSGGTGCMLIKRRVLKRYHPNIAPLRFDKNEGKCGADVYFWKRAQDMKFTARVDANVVCGHLPEYSLSKIEEWLT